MNTRTIGFFLSRAAVVVGGALLLTSPAHAADEETQPGGACNLLSDLWSYNVVHMPNGSLVNTHTSSLPVSCPIQRDNAASTLGIWAAVYVNNPSGQTTTCTFTSSDANGATVDSETVSMSFSGFQALYFNNVNSSIAWGNYNVYCVVPPQGTIYEYYVYEI